MTACQVHVLAKKSTSLPTSRTGNNRFVKSSLSYFPKSQTLPFAESSSSACQTPRSKIIWWCTLDTNDQMTRIRRSRQALSGPAGHEHASIKHGAGGGTLGEPGDRTAGSIHCTVSQAVSGQPRTKARTVDRHSCAR